MTGKGGPPVAPPPTRIPRLPPATSALRRVLKGKVQLWADEWPICGSAQARHVLVELFDYTCPDCRHVHPLVRQAVDAFSGQLTVVSVPIPLDPMCNPLVPMLDARHAGACDYARLALALWRIDRQAFDKLDQTLWAGSQAPPIEQVRQAAQRLVGPGRLEQALHEPVAQQRQIEAIGIFQSAGVGKLPKLLLPEASLWGRVPGTKELFDVLQKQLGLNRPASTTPFSGA